MPNALIDPNDPTNDPNGLKYMDPLAIKNRITMGQYLTKRATEPFAPNPYGVIAAGITGAHGGLERAGAESALSNNQTLMSDVLKRAGSAKDNATASQILTGSGIPGMGEKGLDLITGERRAAADRAANLENQKAMFEAQKKAELDMLPRRHALDLEQQQKLLELRSRLEQEQKSGELERRAALAIKQGMQPGSPEFRRYVLTGELPKDQAGFKINEVGGKLVATDPAGNSKVVYGSEGVDPAVVKNITGGLTELNTIPGRYGGDKGAFGSAVGPFQGDDGGYIMGPVARALGSLYQIRNPQAPSEARRAIQGATDTLASVLKPLIRKPGEGSWSDADQARLDRIMGNLTHANDVKQYRRELDNVRQRINANFSVSIPEIAVPDDDPAGKNETTGSSQALPLISSQGEWEKLPKGTRYRDPKGDIRTKQ
jgi:hypothetical protein